MESNISGVQYLVLRLNTTTPTPLIIVIASKVLSQKAALREELPSRCLSGSELVTAGLSAESVSGPPKRPSLIAVHDSYHDNSGETLVLQASDGTHAVTVSHLSLELLWLTGLFGPAFQAAVLGDVALSILECCL